MVFVKVDRGAVRVPRLAGDGGRTAARAIAARGRLVLLSYLLLRVLLLMLSVSLIVADGTMHSWRI